MLSFAALSETAIAESTTVLDASAFMPSASVTSSAGTINTIHLTANIESPSASSTTAAGSLQVNIEEDLSSVSATTTAGTLGFDAQADTTLAAATATTAVNTFDDVNGKATVTLPAATQAADQRFCMVGRQLLCLERELPLHGTFSTDVEIQTKSSV